MIDKGELRKIVMVFGDWLSDEIPIDYCDPIWHLVSLANRVLNGELAEVMNIEEIDKKILKSISAYWKIEANDVGRELLVIPADRKQVCQAIYDRLKGVNNESS